MLLFDKINIALVVVALVYLLLALLILYRGRGKQVRNFYSLVIFSVILWTLGMFFYRSASAELSLFWCRVLYILATFTASSFFLFSYVFPENKFPSVKKIIFSGILNSFIVILVLVPNIIIKDVNIIEGEEKNIIWGRWYFLYFLYISGLFLSGLIVLLKKHLRSTGIAKLQLKYVFGGYLLGSNLDMFTNLLMVWWGDFRFNWLGQILSAFMVGFTVY